ncbi:MAG: ATP-grasp domain-containing protein [Candidatus Thorarchaeota archaeon]
MRIGLILNTRREKNEFEVEYDPPHTVDLIRKGIENAGYECVFIEADENVVENIKMQKPDLVFNRAEGLKGESRESHIPAILEMLGIPYVGSNVLTTAIALNKGWTKKILAYHGIKSASFEIITNLQELSILKLEFPVILKPNEEGSSIGINEDNVVNNYQKMEKKAKEMIEIYEEQILIEEFIEGREFSVGVLGKKSGEFEVLSIIEIDFSLFPTEVGNVFGQRAKTVLDNLDHYICPAMIPIEMENEIKETTIKICKILDVEDFARIDFRYNQGNELFFLEINPLPGMDFDLKNNDFSFYPYMAFKSGYTYDELVKRIIESACFRYNLNIKI